MVGLQARVRLGSGDLGLFERGNGSSGDVDAVGGSLLLGIICVILVVFAVLSRNLAMAANRLELVEGLHFWTPGGGLSGDG